MCTKTDTTKFEDWNPLDLTGEQAQQIVFNDSYRFKVEEKKNTGMSRWASEHEAIIKDLKTGKFYKTPTYRIGATESQEERPFDDEDHVKFTEVVKVPVESYEWQAV